MVVDQLSTLSVAARLVTLPGLWVLASLSAGCCFLSTNTAGCGCSNASTASSLNSILEA